MEASQLDGYLWATCTGLHCLEPIGQIIISIENLENRYFMVILKNGGKRDDLSAFIGSSVMEVDMKCFNCQHCICDECDLFPKLIISNSTDWSSCCRYGRLKSGCGGPDSHLIDENRNDTIDSDKNGEYKKRNQK